MASFSVNATRFDPYKNFKFRVKWDGRYVAGVSKVGSLKRTTEVVKHRDGGDPSSSRKSPGRTEYEAITGSWRYLIEHRQAVAKVTPADVQRVAKKFLTRENRTVGFITKKEVAQ